MNYLGVFDHFVGLALQGLSELIKLIRFLIRFLLEPKFGFVPLCAGQQLTIINNSKNNSSNSP